MMVPGVDRRGGRGGAGRTALPEETDKLLAKLAFVGRPTWQGELTTMHVYRMYPISMPHPLHGTTSEISDPSALSNVSSHLWSVDPINWRELPTDVGLLELAAAFPFEEDIKGWLDDGCKETRESWGSGCCSSCWWRGWVSEGELREESDWGIKGDEVV
jgi:hypothetical protein